MERAEFNRASSGIRRDHEHRKPPTRSPWGGGVKIRLPLLLAGLMVLSACGDTKSNQLPSTGSIAGNWQFTMAAPSDNSFQGGMQGGFLLQTNGAVTGGVTY